MSDITSTREQTVLIPPKAVATVFVAAAGALVLWSLLAGNQNTDIVTIGGAVRQTYARMNFQYGTTTIDPSTMVASNKIPTDIVNGTSIVTRWGTPVTLTGMGSQFAATFSAASQAQCLSIMDGGNFGGIVSQIQVGSGSAQTVPVDPTTAGTQCASGGDVKIIYVGR